MSIATPMYTSLGMNGNGDTDNAVEAATLHSSDLDIMSVRFWENFIN